jgi:hypothetical protein
MPVPEGEITTTEILQAVAEPATGEYTFDEEVIDDAESVVEEYIIEKTKPKKRASKI